MARDLRSGWILDISWEMEECLLWTAGQGVVVVVGYCGCLQMATRVCYRRSSGHLRWCCYRIGKHPGLEVYGSRQNGDGLSTANGGKWVLYCVHRKL